MRIIILLLTFTVFLISCTSGGDDLSTTCGTIRNGEVFHDIDEELGEVVFITSLTNGNLLTVREVDSGDLVLIQLAGIAEQTNPAQAARAESFALNASGNSRFFRSDDDCTTSVNDLTEIIPGQIILENGLSLAEELLIRGLVSFSTSNECGSELIRNCYQGLTIESSS